MPDESTSRADFLQVDVTGKSTEPWVKLRPRFMDAMERLLDNLTDGQKGAWFEQQAKEFRNLLLSYTKAHLAKPGLENDRIVAETTRIYSEREKSLAEARKIHAEANSQEFENTMRKMRLALGICKAMLVGEKGQESVLFAQQIDSFLSALRAVEQDTEYPRIAEADE